MQQDAQRSEIKTPMKKQERETMTAKKTKERTTRPEMSREQQPVGAATERKTTVTGNSTNPFETKPKTNNPICP
jgi:hypothetical protein